MPNNLSENFLYELLPEAVISQDEFGYIEALTGGFQDCLEDLRSAARKLSWQWEPERLKLPAAATNCVLVRIEGTRGVSWWRSLDFEEDTPKEDSERLKEWAAEKLGLDLLAVKSAIYGYDPFRQVNQEVLANMADTLGTYLHNSLLLTYGKTGPEKESALREAHAKMLATWFPRLRLKGTANSFVVLGRLLGISDLGVVPLWSRLCARRPENAGFPENREDYSSFPDYLPPDGPLYSADDFRDGPYFTWTGTVSNQVDSPYFYTKSFNGVNPWVTAVIQETLNGTTLPAVSNGTISHPVTGKYVLSGGGPLLKASVSPALSSVKFEALTAGDSFNGLEIQVTTTGSLAVYQIEDRLSSIKYRSRYYDVYLWLEESKANELFGGHAVEPNRDLAANPALVADGTAAAPYYAWSSGSVTTHTQSQDWVYSGSLAGSVAVSRRPADSAAPWHDRQFNLEAFDFAGAQVLEALNEVRPATRQVLSSRIGIQYLEDAVYAVYAERFALLDTQSGTTEYAGTVAVPAGSKVSVALEAEFTGVWMVHWSGGLGKPYELTVSYNSGPWQVLGVFQSLESTEFQYYDSVTSGTREYKVYDVQAGTYVPIKFSGSVGPRSLSVQLERSPANSDILEINGLKVLTDYTVSGTFNPTTGQYYLQTANLPGVHYVGSWKLLDTEVIRPEPSAADKSADNVKSMCRPEDDFGAAATLDFADDFQWDKSPVVGGVDISLANTTGTIPGQYTVAEDVPVYTDQDGLDYVGYADNSGDPEHPGMVFVRRSSNQNDYRPGRKALAYQGQFKSLSQLTSGQVALRRLPVGPNLGDTETNYDVLFEPGYALYLPGLVRGVCVADAVKFNGPHHREDLLLWLPLNEHKLRAKQLTDCGPYGLSPVEVVLDKDCRTWDAERGWVLRLKQGRFEFPCVGERCSERTISFWVKALASPTQEIELVRADNFKFVWCPGNVLRVYALAESGFWALIGPLYLETAVWNFVSLCIRSDRAIFGWGDLQNTVQEIVADNAYREVSSEIARGIKVGCDCPTGEILLHDLRMWGVFKQTKDLDLVRYHEPTKTWCLWELGWLETPNRRDRWGLRMLPSGWLAPERLPAWNLKPEPLAYAQFYDSMGNFIGPEEKKLVGISGGRVPPNSVTLGQQHVWLTASGSAAFSTKHGYVPGFNAFWQNYNFGGSYEVLSLSGITGTGIPPVLVSGEPAVPWPPTMAQTNPFRENLYVPGNGGSGMFRVYLKGDRTTTWLAAELCRATRTPEEILVDPVLRELCTKGTVWMPYESYYIKGTLYSEYDSTWHGTEFANGLVGTRGKLGLYDPLTTVYHAGSFAGTHLFIREYPSAAQVVLSGSGTGILTVNPATSQVYVGSYGGTLTTPPQYLYLRSRTQLQAPDASVYWSGRTVDVLGPPVTTPEDNGVDSTYKPEIVGVNACGKYLKIPVLGKAGFLEFQHTGGLPAGDYWLYLVCGQVGMTDPDFSGFDVEVRIAESKVRSKILAEFSGQRFNFTGTAILPLRVDQAFAGNYTLTLEWFNDYENPQRGYKRQLAVYGYELVRQGHELYRVELQPGSPSTIKLTSLDANFYQAGTTPGGWLTVLNSSGTFTAYWHESAAYNCSDVEVAERPLADSLTALTGEQISNLMYGGTHYGLSNEPNLDYPPTFGSVLEVSSYNPAKWFWSGLSSSGSEAWVTARLTSISPGAVLVLSESLDFSNRIYSDRQATDANSSYVVKFHAGGLKPWTTYYYALEHAGSLHLDFIGTLHTCGTGAHNFIFGMGACEYNVVGTPQANNQIWNKLLEKGIRFFVHTGDFHYNNITNNSIYLYRGAFDDVLSESVHKSFYSKIPVVYMWDDHDYGDNDSDSTSPSRPAARAVFHSDLPHPPLEAGAGDNPVYFTLDVGRCRFIFTDNRSERTPHTVADSPSKTVLGARQKQWFKEQLLAASNDPNIKAIFWVNSFPWTGTSQYGANPPVEHWAAYPTERKELADFIKNNNIRKLFILSGDMHACAIDDGRTWDFAQDKDNPVYNGHGLPIFHAAPLGNNSSSKGGPYLIGPAVLGGFKYQAGVVTVSDSGGDSVLINFTGIDQTGAVINSSGTNMTLTLSGTASPRP
jgi:alkaline phosphatase D